jgi:hypothetical protein
MMNAKNVELFSEQDLEIIRSDLAFNDMIRYDRNDFKNEKLINDSLQEEHRLDTT